jgi:hypothetical protein
MEMGDPPNTFERTLFDIEEFYVIMQAKDQPDFGYTKITNFLKYLEFPPNNSVQYRKDIRQKISPTP